MRPRKDTPPLPVAPRATLSRLWKKHAVVMSMLSCTGLAVLGLTEMAFGYRESLAHVGRTQHAQAREVANAVRGSLESVERQIGAITLLPWEIKGWLTPAQRREEYLRLLRIAPAVEAIAYFDAQGNEQLAVSRRDIDRIARTDTVAAAREPLPRNDPRVRCVYAPVQYTEAYEPSLSLEMSTTETGNSDRTLTRLNLRTLAAELAQALAIEGSTAYVADRTGRVVLARDPGLMLERRRVELPPSAPEEDDAMGVPGFGVGGGRTITSWVSLPELGWRVVVEQPRSDALAPVRDTLLRTGAFTLGWLVLAVVSAFYFAMRLTRPVLALSRGAESIAAGHLATRIDVPTGDELEDLAKQFNHMAASLEDSYLHLEEKVAEKTRDLQQANRHKSEFLANMSHELRTPLNAIIGFSEALTEQMFGPLNDKQLEYARDIHGSGHHLLTLINDILDLSKIEAGRLEPEPSDFNVAAAISNATTLVRDRCLRQGLALVTDVAPDVGDWHADPRRFKQILLNLLSNAVKFTPSGGTVTVAARIVGDRLEVRVSDTGVGIAEADAGVIFEPFVQVGKDGTSRGEGTGLGLSLVRRLVELQGGDIHVESRPDEGAHFTFRLPKGTP